ncbi:hypothetical protein BDZ94DRAFT_1310955 [Collybia nuda]|uniref:DUF6534 domain-containing protein n=1 Tax=Collybia nuda TaxID=64659 RepID=A0A9P6CHP5_9AGAR|nr:hypothetical protein BDZ94DRAFT_1310955 [Collybia nuda]
MIDNSTNILDSTAPLLLGSILNWGFYGGLCVQTYYYYFAFPKDRRVLKALVYGLLLIETSQSVIIARDLFTTFVTGFGHVVELIETQFIWLSTPVMTGIVSSIVQIFFAHRIHVISGSKKAGTFIVLLALMQGSSAIICGMQVHSADDSRKIYSKALASTTIWLIGSAVCDNVIAIFMVYFLSRRATGIKATQTLVTKLTRLTIETGLLTATIALIDATLFLALPTRNLHVAPALILGKLYSNTLVANLNSRPVIPSSHNDTFIDEILSCSSGNPHVDDIQRIQFPVINSSSRDEDTTVAISIEREI